MAWETRKIDCIGIAVIISAVLLYQYKLYRELKSYPKYAIATITGQSHSKGKRNIYFEFSIGENLDENYIGTALLHEEEQNRSSLVFLR